MFEVICLTGGHLALSSILTTKLHLKLGWK